MDLRGPTLQRNWRFCWPVFGSLQKCWFHRSVLHTRAIFYCKTHGFCSPQIDSLFGLVWGAFGGRMCAQGVARTNAACAPLFGASCQHTSTYICIFMHAYIYRYMCTHLHILICMHTPTHVCTYTHRCVYTHAHICMHAHTCTYSSVYLRMYMCAHVHILMWIHIYIYMCI